MSSKPVVLRHESPEAFDQLRRALHTEYAPTDRFQAALVDQMAAARWLILRAERLEDEAITAALDHGAFAEAVSTLGTCAGVHAVQTRAFQRALRLLRRCQERAALKTKNTDIEPNFLVPAGSRIQ